MLSEVFWVAFISTASALIIKIASLAYKSKCKECKICCIKVVRDTTIEEKEEEFRISHSIQNQKSEVNNAV
jgi:hypothetical protein